MEDNKPQLLEPKEINLHSNVRDKDVKFKIGYYPATEGVRLLGLAAEIFDIAARGKKKESSGLFGENLQSLSLELCKYVDVQLSNGNWMRLDSKLLIDQHVPCYETLLSLVKEVHDYNSDFFTTGKLLKTSLGLMDQLKAQAMKMLNQLSGSSSRKK